MQAAAHQGSAYNPRLELQYSDFQFATTFSHSINNEAFSWELFDFPFWRRWAKQNFPVLVVFAAIYLALVFSGRRWMTHKQPYKLRTCLIIWNVSFAAFSFIAFGRTFPDLWAVLWQEDGFYKSVCSSEGLTIQFAFWSWIGTLSKIAELGDTLFIVLRKQPPLILLHWYHHVSTMLYTWFTFPEQEPCHRWLMTMNFFVHILMYLYYAFKASGLKPPRLVAATLTSLQILQMIVGIFVNWYTWKEISSSRSCERHHFNLIVATIMYASYFVLFADFFYKSYFKSPKKKQT